MNSEVVEDEMLAFFPNGVRVLLVDEDSKFLKTATVMLSQLQYKVATCGSPTAAMRFLSGDRVKDLDVLLVDAHQVANCGFDLRIIVENDLNIPVIYFMSNLAATSDTQSNRNLARVVQSATYIITKPLNSGEVSRLWRIVASRKCALEEVRRSKNRMSLLDKINNVETECVQYKAVRAINGGRKGKNNRGDNSNSCGDDNTEVSPGSGESQNQRVMWTPSLKKKFENVLKIIGTGAHPNEILGQMNVKGLRRHHVASYLQKYRAKLDKKKNDRCGGTAPSPGSSQNSPKEQPTASPKLFFTGAVEEFTGENDATAVLPSPLAGNAPLIFRQPSGNSATNDTVAPADQLPMETPNIAAMAFGGGNDAPAPLSSWSPSLLFAVGDDVSSSSAVPVAIQAAYQHQPSSAVAFTDNAAPSLLPWDASAVTALTGNALLPWDPMLQEQNQQVMVDAAAQEEEEAAAMVAELLAPSNNSNVLVLASNDDGALGVNHTTTNRTITFAGLEAFLMQDIPIDDPRATGNGDEGGSGT